MRRRIVKITVWSIALAIALFICHVSANLYAYTKHSDGFNTDDRQVTFYQLFRYAAYLDAPPSLDACINKLRHIDGAKQQWALETKPPTDATPTWDDIRPYLGRGSNSFLPQCPKGGIYTIGSLTNYPKCSVKGHTLD
jgi:hypothetical protein